MPGDTEDDTTPVVEYTLDQAADLLKEWLEKYQKAEPGAWDDLETRTKGFLVLHDLADHGVVSSSATRRVAAEVEGQQAATGAGKHRKPEGGWRGRVFP